MKYLILNSSGNVGKSTITKLLSSVAKTQILEIEDVNSSNSNNNKLDVEKFGPGSDFFQIYEKIMFAENNIIVDVGASSLARFIEKMSEFAGVESVFDTFIVPTRTSSNDKVETDTFRTLKLLESLDVLEKTEVIFNFTESQNIEEEFPIIFNSAKTLNGFELDKDLHIPNSTELFKQLTLVDKELTEVYNTDVDFYKEKMLSATTPQDKMLNLKQDLMNRLIHKKAKGSFDYVLNKLTGKTLTSLESTPTTIAQTSNSVESQIEEIEEEF